MFKRRRKRPVTLSDQQMERYQYQLALPGMTTERQLQLAESAVVVLGLNATGAACALHLAQAGLGRIVLVDEDRVARHDLASHPLLAADVGRSKVEAIAERIAAINPDVRIEQFEVRFDAHNAECLLYGVDIAVEGLNSWQDKLLASDSCMHVFRPLIHACLMDFSFHVFSMMPGKSACLRCVFTNLGLDDLPADRPGRGEMGAIAGLAGAFQAAEAIKLITKLGTISGNHLLRFDVLRSEFDDMTQLTGRSDCPDCGRWG